MTPEGRPRRSATGSGEGLRRALSARLTMTNPLVPSRRRVPQFPLHPYSLADIRNEHRGVVVEFGLSGYVRHGRVARLVLADSNETAAAGELEGPPCVVDGVGNVHGDRTPGAPSMVRGLRTNPKVLELCFSIQFLRRASLPQVELRTKFSLEERRLGTRGGLYVDGEDVGINRRDEPAFNEAAVREPDIVSDRRVQGPLQTVKHWSRRKARPILRSLGDRPSSTMRRRIPSRRVKLTSIVRRR